MKSFDGEFISFNSFNKLDLIIQPPVQLFKTIPKSISSTNFLINSNP